MSSDDKFHEWSYARHASHFAEYADGGDRAATARTWFNNDTVDAWRHQRMYHSIDPVLACQPEASWVTVGDGRYGKDAKYIVDKGCSALATDISDVLLKEAKALGYIDQYRCENAEHLSFTDGEFDYVLCKESYHHFPRPMLALHEMLRVAKRGVLLIEPNDISQDNRLLATLYRQLIDIARFVSGRSREQHQFEESGNYVYGISRREMEKVALGSNFPTVAFKGLNDAYERGVEHETIEPLGALQKRLRRRINVANLRCKLGLTDYRLLSAIIFKAEPSTSLNEALTQSGYEVVTLPKNPYVENA